MGKVALASVRKACQDALLIMLRSEDAALMALEQRLVRGLTALQAELAAEEAIKRRNTYASHAFEHAFLRDLTCLFRREEACAVTLGRHRACLRVCCCFSLVKQMYIHLHVQLMLIASVLRRDRCHKLRKYFSAPRMVQLLLVLAKQL